MQRKHGISKRKAVINALSDTQMKVNVERRMETRTNASSVSFRGARPSTTDQVPRNGTLFPPQRFHCKGTTGAQAQLGGGSLKQKRNRGRLMALTAAKPL